MGHRPNYDVRAFTWSRNFFLPTTSRCAVPGLREILKNAEMLRDIPKCSEFTLDFTLFYHEFSPGFLRQLFAPRKHNTVQNMISKATQHKLYCITLLQAVNQSCSSVQADYRTSWLHLRCRTVVLVLPGCVVSVESKSTKIDR